jgi:hypothetical protein
MAKKNKIGGNQGRHMSIYPQHVNTLMYIGNQPCRVMTSKVYRLAVGFNSDIKPEESC